MTFESQKKISLIPKLDLLYWTGFYNYNSNKLYSIYVHAHPKYKIKVSEDSVVPWKADPSQVYIHADNMHIGYTGTH